MNALGRCMKRALDVGISTLVLSCTGPALASIALVIKLDSPGRVLFRQERVGRKGAVFRIIKFRTMVEAAPLQFNSAGRVDCGSSTDPRYTRVGRLLRRFSVDELPQLVNVLLGQMSLVGPRPDLPVALEVDRGRYRDRLLVRPGLTGLAQVSGRNQLSLEEKWELDAKYAANISLAADVAILARTLLVVAGADGLYKGGDLHG